MSQLQIYSYRVAFICRLFLFLLPVGIVYFWLTIQTQYSYLSMTGLVQFGLDIHELTQSSLSMQTRLISIFVSLLYSLILMRALILLMTLFNRYKNGDIFTQENTQLYKKLGFSVFYWIIAGVLYNAVMTVVLSFNNPPGQRILSVSFTGVDLLSLFVGFLIVMVSWVMQEAYKIRDENIHTI